MTQTYRDQRTTGVSDDELSTEQAAKVLGINEKQVRVMARRGELVPVPRYGRGNYFARQDIYRLKDEMRRKSWRDGRRTTPPTHAIEESHRESWRDKARRDGVGVPPEIADQLDKLEASRDKHEYGVDVGPDIHVQGRRERSERSAYLRDESTRLKERRVQVRKLIPPRATTDPEALDELLDEIVALTEGLSKIEHELELQDPRQPDTSPQDHDLLIYADLIAFFMTEGASFEQAQAVLIRDAEDEAAEIAIRTVTPELADACLQQRLGQSDRSTEVEGSE